MLNNKEWKELERLQRKTKLKVVKEKKQKTTIVGEVSELSPQTLSIRTNEGYRLVEVADVLEIRLWEEGVYD